MLRHVSRRAVLFVVASLLPAAFRISRPVRAAQQTTQATQKTTVPLRLHTTRQSRTDLEILGISQAPHTYLTYAELEGLPQVSTTLVDHPDFPGQTVHVTGIPLEALIEAVNVPPSLDLITAFCTDLYHTHFPAAYTRSHHPILVLAVEGQRSAIWAKATHKTDPGPYLIVYDHFVPDFKILAHEDEPQIPINITALRFTSAAQTFSAIAPPAGTPPDSPIQQGFAIAKQNCLRCHAMGAVGGKKSNVTWSTISSLAKARPDIIGSYILNPKSIIPDASMPGWPEYDAPTIAALTAYFQSLPPASSSSTRRVTHE